MRILSKRIVTYLIEYLGEFEFIFEIILDYESGYQMGSFDAKNHHQKSHAWAPLTPFSVNSEFFTGILCMNIGHWF